jgi:hypothetical protein
MRSAGLRGSPPIEVKGTPTLFLHSAGNAPPVAPLAPYFMEMPAQFD